MFRRGVAVAILLIIVYFNMSFPNDENASVHVNDGRPLVSIINLVANQELYDGKRITVFGFAVLLFENRALYFSDEFTRLPPLSVLLTMDKYECKYNYKYVMVEGKFISSKGRLPLGEAGEITDITKIEKWDEKFPHDLGKNMCIE